MGFGFWVLGFWVLGFGFWVLGFGFWVWGFGFGVWGLGFSVSGFELSVSDFNFRVTGDMELVSQLFEMDFTLKVNFSASSFWHRHIQKFANCITAPGFSKPPTSKPVQGYLAHKKACPP